MHNRCRRRRSRNHTRRRRAESRRVKTPLLRPPPGSVLRVVYHTRTIFIIFTSTAARSRIGPNESPRRHCERDPRTRAPPPYVLRARLLRRAVLYIIQPDVVAGSSADRAGTPVRRRRRPHRRGKMARAKNEKRPRKARQPRSPPRKRPEMFSARGPPTAQFPRNRSALSSYQLAKYIKKKNFILSYFVLETHAGERAEPGVADRRVAQHTYVVVRDIRKFRVARAPHGRGKK